MEHIERAVCKTNTIKDSLATIVEKYKDYDKIDANVVLLDFIKERNKKFCYYCGTELNETNYNYGISRSGNLMCIKCENERYH